MLFICLTNLIFILFADVNANQTIITTTPHLPQNVLASGHFGLKLTSLFVNQNYEECLWSFQSNSIPFLNLVLCANHTRNGLHVICARNEDSDSMITTSLVVTYPLNTTDNPADFFIQCRSSSGGFSTIAVISIVIQGNIFLMGLIIFKQILFQPHLLVKRTVISTIAGTVCLLYGIFWLTFFGQNFWNVWWIEKKAF